MARIGILETQAHEQVVYYLSKILTSGDHNVSLYTNNKIRETIERSFGELEKIEWIIKEKENSMWSFLQQVSEDAKEKDILIINPLYGGVRNLLPFVKFNPECETVFFIFNINTWLFGEVQLHDGLRRLSRNMMRRQIVSNMDGYLVEYPALEDYIQKNLSSNKDVHYFVPTIYRETDEVNKNKKTTIVVPGNISPSRRNYNLILDLFKYIAEPNGHLQLKFLGRAVNDRGEKIIETCEDLSREGYNVSWANNWVPFEQFHREIHQSDIILAPLVREFNEFGVTEFYGKSKGSGCIADALRNGKAIVLPSHFQVERVMGDSAIYYHNTSSLESILRRIKDDPSFLLNLKKKAQITSENFTIHSQLNRLNKIVDNYT